MTSARDPHDDLLPPPSSSEPYEVFLARVGRATSHSSGISTQPAAAALPSASVTTVTTGILFPTPFHTYKVSSWMHHPSYKPLGLGCRYQRRSTRLFLSLGVARTGLRRNHFSCQCLPAHYAVGCLRRTSRTLPQEALHLFLLFQTLKNALSYPPPRFRGFFSSATPPFRPASREPHTTVPPRPTSVAPTVTQPDAVNSSQGSFPDVIQNWQEEFMRDMKTCWNKLLVTLHLSQLWVPLFRSRTWAPTRCGS